MPAFTPARSTPRRQRPLGAIAQRLTRLLVVGSVLTLGGCLSPARPLEELVEVPASRAQAAPLNGVYEATFRARFAGPMKTRIIAQPTTVDGEPGFKANTPTGRAWGLVGGFESALGQLIAPFIFPNGTLLIWESPVAHTDQPVEGNIGPTTLRKYQAKTLYRSVDKPIEISFDDSKTIAVMTLRKLTPAEAARPPEKSDYPGLVDGYAKALREHYFDPKAASGPELGEYLSSLRTGALKAQDDVEFVFALALGWRKYSKFPLPTIYRRPDPKGDAPLFAQLVSEQAPASFTIDSKTRIATIDLVFIKTVEQVDQVFQAALAQQPSGLIIDLRNCVGTELAALRAVSWVRSQDIDAGAFFGPLARPAFVNDGPDAKGETTTKPQRAAALASFQRATLDAPDDYDRAYARLVDLDALALTVRRKPDAFAGPVVVLTARRTFSTGEVLARTLQLSGVPVVGSRTGKRPTLSREIPLTTDGDTWITRLPRYDWCTPAGDLTRSTGVEPDVRVDKDQAPAEAVKMIQAMQTQQASAAHQAALAP